MASGRIDHQTIAFVIAGFSGVVALTDILWGKIYNWLIVLMLVTGLLAAVFGGGWLLFFRALLGAGAGLGLFGWMFGLGLMGGGDVKFLMALGVWGGPGYAFEVALLSILVGGALALATLLIKGRARSLLHRVQVSAMTLVVKDMKFEPPQLDRKLTMPFGVPMAIAAVWVAFGSPFGGFF